MEKNLETVTLKTTKMSRVDGRGSFDDFNVNPKVFKCQEDETIFWKRMTSYFDAKIRSRRNLKTNPIKLR